MKLTHFFKEDENAMQINKKIKYLKKNYTLQMSPRTFLKEDLYKRYTPNSIPKKRKKISDDDFEIPDFSDYQQLLTINYNVRQLKTICRFYKQKVGGNKPQLIHLLYNYLKYSYFSIKIQKIYKGYMRRKLNKLRGPCIFTIHKCVNETDFYTLENLKDLEYQQLFCFKDTDNFVYGFDICSLYNMLAIEKCNKNPYNRKIIPLNTLGNIKKIINLGKILKEKINITLEDSIDELSLSKQRELRAMSLFQLIDDNGFITDANWFINLSRNRLRGFIRELLDIWRYRAEISNETKRKINPLHGDPFWNININILLSKPFEVLQTRILDIIEIFITEGEEDGRALGTYYILGALTIVSQEAAMALPWLYESFIPNL